MQAGRLFFFCTVLLCFAATAAAQSTGTSTSSARRDFIQDSLRRQQFDINAGNLAIQRGQDRFVRQLGATIVQDHTAILGNLRALARRRGVSSRAALTQSQRSDLQLLNSLDGTDFDQAFLSMMVANHHVELMQLQNQAASSSDVEVRNFAASAIPVVENDLGLALAQQQSFCSVSGTNGTTTTGTGTTTTTDDTTTTDTTDTTTTTTTTSNGGGVESVTGTTTTFNGNGNFGSSIGSGLRSGSNPTSTSSGSTVFGGTSGTQSTTAAGTTTDSTSAATAGAAGTSTSGGIRFGFGF